jgi:hypothetical protein
VPCNLGPIYSLLEARIQQFFIEAGIPVAPSEGSPADVEVPARLSPRGQDRDDGAEQGGG